MISSQFIVLCFVLNVTLIGGTTNTNMAMEQQPQISKETNVDLSLYLATDASYQGDYEPEIGTIDNIYQSLEEMQLYSQGGSSNGSNSSNSQGSKMDFQPQQESGSIEIERSNADLGQRIENNLGVDILFQQIVTSENTNFEQVLADLVGNPCNLTEQVCAFTQQTIRFVWDEESFSCFPSRECVFQGFQGIEECERECRDSS